MVGAGRTEVTEVIATATDSYGCRSLRVGMDAET